MKFLERVGWIRLDQAGHGPWGVSFFQGKIQETSDCLVFFRLRGMVFGQPYRYGPSR